MTLLEQYLELVNNIEVAQQEKIKYFQDQQNVIARQKYAASLLAKYQKSHDKIEPYVENLDSYSIPQEFIDEAKLTVPYFDGTKITNASKAYYDWKMKLTVEDFIALAQEMSDEDDENNNHDDD